MNFRQLDVPGLYLKPGEMAFKDKPTRVTTVLGSCIAVTMFVERLGVGAVCHALLPACREIEMCDERCAMPYRYVSCVVPDMVARFVRMGAAPGEIQVKMFGGGDMFGPARREGMSASVGSQNIRAARQALEEHRLRIRHEDVGGRHGRKIHFLTHTGDVWLKRLNRENRLMRQLNQQNTAF